MRQATREREDEEDSNASHHARQRHKTQHNKGKNNGIIQSMSLRANWPVRNEANSLCKACSLARDCATTNCSRSSPFDQSAPRVKCLIEVTSLVSKHMVLLRTWEIFCQHQVAPCQPALASLPQIGSNAKQRLAATTASPMGARSQERFPYQCLLVVNFK